MVLFAWSVRILFMLDDVVGRIVMYMCLHYSAINMRRFWGFYVTSVPTTERFFSFFDDKDFAIFHPRTQTSCSSLRHQVLDSYMSSSLSDIHNDFHVAETACH